MIRTIQLYLIVILLVAAFVTPTFGESIKLATLAPKTSLWMKIFYAMGREIKEKSNGELKIRFFPDGVQGDEIDVIRKMRAGLLHAGAMTSVGLGEIQKEVLIFQAPLLFQSYAELDYVRERLRAGLDQAFAEAGYILLGWGDIGYYYLFSNQPIQSVADVRNPNVKMWVRVDDPVGIHFFKSIGGIGVPQSVPQVLPSLYSGQINALVVSPLACIALQWYPKLKYMMDMPLGIGVGATIITKEKYDQLSAESRRILRETAQKHHQELIHHIREANDKSIVSLEKKAGMQIVTVSDADRAGWNQFAARVRGELAGQIYSQELLDQVNAQLDEYRARAK
ncbi:MAG: TRAP transporter substrate-binding protein DctP [Candidatus Poribacteria bacterium]|nr:TRAP transporter substrate-binding protein DctP [Candidatus Poribacteria bacterium]